MVGAKRKAIETLYAGVCSISNQQDVIDPITKITKHKEVIIVESQPCRLSFKRINASNQTDTAAGASQTIKLFIAPEVIVKPGSKITVTQNGVTTEYTNSGEPATYSSHQEIMLELFKEWL